MVWFLSSGGGYAYDVIRRKQKRIEDLKKAAEIKKKVKKLTKKHKVLKRKQQCAFRLNPAFKNSFGASRKLCKKEILMGSEK